MTKELTPFSQNDYEIKEREVLCQGDFVTLARYHVKHQKFNGDWTNIFTREILERKSAVGILPYDPVTDQVVLIQQFRAGAIANPQSPWLIEVIAGVYGANETPKEVALREAKEEANCEILNMYPIANYFASPGGSNEHLQLFCGHIKAENIDGVYGLSEENEDINAFVLPAEEAFQWVQAGKIQTSPALISLLWLQLNREWLRQLWQTK